MSTPEPTDSGSDRSPTWAGAGQVYDITLETWPARVALAWRTLAAHSFAAVATVLAAFAVVWEIHPAVASTATAYSPLPKATWWIWVAATLTLVGCDLWRIYRRAWIGTQVAVALTVVLVAVAPLPVDDKGSALSTLAWVWLLLTYSSHLPRHRPRRKSR